MEIVLREDAKTQLSNIKFKENEGIRITTEQENSCSLFVDYTLFKDKQKDNDTVIVTEGIPFIISESTKEILPEKVYLNFVNPTGYKLYTDEEILKANMRLKLN
ncbi:iron-sulfur cluster biosynthesis family protein [Caldibacillus thermolactis]|jgi:Fe-S cluster assembly iron-binding protein IscA|uniref:Iron-sulfur cluster biosynthesis family protein n=1 Tax=Pallidibacillus thermolactis TaxID=251051 RepID=A0ABT2WIF7_9BACI|nr:iron-sulfur cluster biosynthesis family protein [Pallidibacillus thermolactis]MCU9594766.1 iron-sulfur cluster biosynthesis family protein [Pallidibacillus thermolactis]MCU9601474.1 iron-sulfur cluster biosynthesis family protein [Pallidibacillus thermolactis subsp. kokeshiiformis]MED1673572.1 iron-sulfur cluster biosynthesis family protein [Pallidibacillus thermolactis subsp. kokeshiiformis]